jgi:DNA-binding GntR family transcriptional regulator
MKALAIRAILPIVYNMQNTIAITRHRARDQVRTILEKLIRRGELSGGARLEEVELSRRIGVSRTPLREALIALEEDGLVQSSPNKGFTVVPANEALVREIYPILGALEGAALRLSLPQLKAAAPELKAINDKLSRATDKARQHEFDMQFHARLTHGCGNPRLLKLLDTHWTQARRFDGAQRRGTADREGSCREHAEIVRAIEDGRAAAAVEALIAHWRRGEDTVINWLRGGS